MTTLTNGLRERAHGLAEACARLPTWADALLVACASVAIALGAFRAWPLDLASPLAIGGDGYWYQFLIKSVLTQGWYSTNPDVGAPFGAQLSDFPIPEPTNLLLVRAFGVFSLDPFVVFNLFYLASFATGAIAARWAFARLGTGRLLAMTGAILFAILPYHFLRLGHLLLASYFAAAILGCYAMRLAMYRAPHLADMPRARPGSLLLIAIAAGAGVYYAFFGCLFLVLGASIGAAQSHRTEPLRVGAVYIAVVIAIVVAGTLPTLLYHLAGGGNALVAHRLPQEAEIYGLRITQLLLPTTGHRVGWMAAVTNAYNAGAPLINENKFAALGLLGSIGLVAAIAICLTGCRSRFPQLAATGALATGGILFATIGGFGSLFAWLVTPEIRGLNRISVFVAFFAILSTLLLIRGLFTRRPHSWWLALTSIMLVAVGWIDQIPVHAIARADTTAFRQQRAFFDRLQADLAPDTAVYELPYMSFPESPRVGKLFSYDLLAPYICTHGLRWSFGGMRGRAADVWDEKVSNLDGAEFIAALSHAGFGAIYVDRRGYADHGAAIDRSLVSVLGKPLLEDARHDLEVYRIPGDAKVAGRPFIVVGPGRGWYPWGKDAQGDPTGWSSGDADLIVANPNGAALPFIVQFQSQTLRPRTLMLSYNGRPIGEQHLQPGPPHGITLKISAQPGLSRIQLTSDSPAARASHSDSRPFAFRVGGLAYGVSP